MHAKLRTYSVILLVGIVAALGIAPAAAQDDPSSVVSSFYSWFLDYTGYDEASDEFRNPLVDGSYRERPELSSELIEQVAAIQEEQGGYHYDPFTCAQEVAESFEIVEVDLLTDRDAIVIVNTYFGWNPHPNTFVVALTEQNDLWRIQDVLCQESVTPRGVTESFYAWYFEQAPDGEALDESYPFLTDDLNADIQQARSQRTLGDGDPVLCGQDIPAWIAVNEVMVGQDHATMLVREFYRGNPHPKLVTVELVNAGQWMIEAIECELAPETVAELLYNEYIRFMRYDADREIERTPIADWAVYPWAEYMGDKVLEGLLSIFRGDEPISADPFLCAQDLPAWITAEPVLGPQSDCVSVQIVGAYPSGPSITAEVNLAEVCMSMRADGSWMLLDLTCAR